MQCTGWSAVMQRLVLQCNGVEEASLKGQFACLSKSAGISCDSPHLYPCPMYPNPYTYRIKSYPLPKTIGSSTQCNWVSPNLTQQLPHPSP